MKKYLLSIFTLLAALTLAASDNISDEAEETESELKVELSTPRVGKKQQAYVRTYMRNVAEALYREGFEVETMREGEVVIVVIPTDGLFMPNESQLYASAPKTLDKFRKYFVPKGRYKIIFAVHSDNTGSEDYLFTLTEGRVNALLDYYQERGVDIDGVIGFPMGASEPLTDNSTRAERAENRRLEIYFVPGEELINQAKNTKK